MRQSSHFWKLFLISTFCLLVSHLGLCGHAHALSRKLTLLEFDGKRYRSLWTPEGCFADTLKKRRNTFSAVSALKLSSGTKQSHFAKLSRKFDIPLYPSLVLKPFILVEELKWALARYQSQQIQAPVDQNYQIQSSSNAKSSASFRTSRRTSQKKPFLFSPYYRRLYGLHIELQW